MRRHAARHCATRWWLFPWWQHGTECSQYEPIDGGMQLS